MSVTAGEELSLSIEKPVAGGRMIARHEGQVVLVAGAIPGEYVRARIERVDNRLAFGGVVAVLQASDDRRDPAADPRCGGLVYAHIRYERQLGLKAEVIADAFARLGRLPLDAAVPIAGSPQGGYRMRARFHVRGATVGFFREGTHEICDPAASGQLLDVSVAAVKAAVASLADDGAAPVSVELSENLRATERALHADVAFGAAVSEPALARAATAGGLTGCTARTPSGVLTSAGNPTVGDSLSELTGGRAAAGELRRHPESFFQANRHLLPSLVSVVMDAIPPEGPVLDLYAGVGLFSLSLAGAGRSDITAVEGDPSSVADLRRNAGPFEGPVRVVTGSVENHLARAGGGAVGPGRRRAETIIVDPPRTGISKEAMAAITRYGAGRIVYVSCDAPTMARDARRLVDGGYVLTSLRGFDLFPNTPHVEMVAIFDRHGSP
jgi:23S rRNA (uracil1939-C5)-methyltransferase